MILDILEEHIEEADFLFCQRQLAFGMLDLNGEDLAEMDERLRAHLNGLLLSQDAAWDFVRDFLTTGSAGEAFVEPLDDLFRNIDPLLEFLQVVLMLLEIGFVLDQVVVVLLEFTSVTGVGIGTDRSHRRPRLPRLLCPNRLVLL